MPEKTIEIDLECIHEIRPLSSKDALRAECIRCHRVTETNPYTGEIKILSREQAEHYRDSFEIDLEESQKWPQPDIKRWYLCIPCGTHYYGGPMCPSCNGIETDPSRSPDSEREDDENTRDINK